jgi:predicted phage-related endonuclease
MTIERVPITDRMEWLAWRGNYIGASEVGIVCGLSHYGSTAELYAMKKGLRPPLDAAVLRRGRRGEPAAFRALGEDFPDWEVQPAKVHVRDRERRIAATPDGYAKRPDRKGIGNLQIKVIGRSIFRQRWLDDPDDSIEYGDASVPPGYRLQTLTEMMLDDNKWGVLAVLISGEFDWPLRVFDVERDEVLEDRILYCCDNFWREHLDPGIMPPFEPQRDAELIKHLFPRDDGSEIDLTGDNRTLALVEDLAVHQAALKLNREQEKLIKTELQGKLGAATYGRLADGRRISFRTHHRKAYTVAASDYRVLRVLKSTSEREAADD